MGSVGHSVLSRLFIGSVTNSVLHLVTQPTVAVVYP
jgi:nucleotide-binding universal stress UspA family protein